MALENTTFITVADVKAALDISETTWDAVIESLINSCTRFAMNYCGGRRLIAPTSDETEYYNGANQLWLKNYPIKSITSISYRTGDYNNPVWVAFNPATDYLVDEATGKVAIHCAPSGMLALKVVYKGGYDTAANVPADLKMAVIESVSREFNRRKSMGVNSESVGGASVSWNQNHDTMLTSVLDFYRTFVV